MNTKSLIIREFDLLDYATAFNDMRVFTETRDENTPDELWFLQHPAVFTQGMNGKPEHILNTTHIPIIQTDRGGQITYHGPGQLVIYPLFDLRRTQLGVRNLVSQLENIVIDLLSEFNISAVANANARGVYVNGAKIASIGLRIKRHCSYHGVALNVNMDLTPFAEINPCGYHGLKMTQIADFNPQVKVKSVIEKIKPMFMERFGYC
ncbi:MAG: lipoyl(octanoyl) transferase LipB [Legionellales bacterium]|nr:lipoyl(octanoyl) transferase LipB [Legionellales bacterium]